MKILPSYATEKKVYPILETIQRCGLSPKKTGRTYMLTCPFHSERTPSFVIFPDSQTWKCFGNCVKDRNGGDAIEFVKQFKQLNYVQALEWLNQYSQPFNIKWEPPKKAKIVPPENVLYYHSLMDLDGRRDYYYSRGFSDDFINTELWGWDGDRYTLPVWEGEPGNSACLGVRRRVSVENEAHQLKYIGLKDHNQPTVWGRWYCREAKTALAFAGEFDAARAVCDQFPSFSLVNGVSSFEAFPQDWPHLWFPTVENIIVVFDIKEEVWAGRFAAAWNKAKGMMKAQVFHWPYVLGVKDYCKFRENYSHFKMLVFEQLRIKIGD